ncbi:hypothetical protein QR66_00070 [Chromobacterium piscinae]|nr:hypothetical protein QR66_00070 [Chromobacterium piscinae]
MFPPDPDLNVRAQVREFVWSALHSGQPMPGSTAVREHIGAGSLTTITSELRKIRAEWAELQRRQSTLPGLPASVAHYAAPFLQNLWKDACQQAETALRPPLEEAHQAVQALKTRLAECEDQLIAKVRDHGQLQTDWRHRGQLLEERGRALDRLQHELDRARQQAQAEREAAQQQQRALQQAHAADLAAAEAAGRQSATRLSLLHDELLATRQQAETERARLQDSHQAALREQAQQLEQQRQKALTQGQELVQLRQQLVHRSEAAEQAAQETAAQKALVTELISALKERDGQLHALQQQLAATQAEQAATQAKLDTILQRLSPLPSALAATGEAQRST